jgi:hypothetical protein
MLDVVYICRDGENEELRYSIRSVVKNLPHARLWVVGGKPDWYTGRHIKVKQLKNKFENARANVTAIAKSGQISEDFILMNDDFFVISPVDEVRYYFSGTLKSKIEYFISAHPSSQYTALLQRSMKVLINRGVEEPLDYALHVPVIMNRKKLLEVLPLGISWRLSYCNIYNVGGQQVNAPSGSTKDVKIYIKDDQLTDISQNPLSEFYMSTDDKSFIVLKSFFEEMFPDKSRYES